MYGGGVGVLIWKKKKMLKISAERLPKLIVNDLSYLVYYSVYWFLFSLFFLIPISIKYLWMDNIEWDYQLIVQSIVLWIFIWVLFKIFITPIERKLIKRNIFVAWFIKVLKKNENLTFNEILDKYSYFLFQNRKYLSSNSEWEAWLEALIALDIIELKNEKELKIKGKNFDYFFLVRI